VVGNEANYLDWFFASGTWGRRGIAADARDEFIAAYTGRESLRCGFEYYRAMRRNAEQIASVLQTKRLTVPTTAIGGNVVGDALYRQLAPIADHLTGHVIAECGHILPLDRPGELLSLLVPFAAAS